MKALIVYFLFVLGAGVVAAQPYVVYQASEAGITSIANDKIRDQKLPGAVITLSGFSHQLEVKAVLPLTTVYPDQHSVSSPESPVSFDLKMIVSSNKMQRDLTSLKVYTANGILQLNNVSKPVTVQYSPFPEGTEDEGQMLISLIVTFRL